MGVREISLNIPEVLLQIGYLTTPPSSSGVSLSEFWAWVRYLAAVTEDSSLCLTGAFGNLDAHQKTILSDDFGMGVPMTWLSDKLNFVRICDGRYFLERFASRAGATARRQARRGPNKTPDFVARDAAGVWHVIECKGTQSGSLYQARQIGQPGPPPTGGIAQKHSIVFPPGYTGQRLVCALSIAIQDVPTTSTLRIVDPEPEDPVVVQSDELTYADDAAERGMVAKALRLAGFEATADVTAAPMGRFAWSYKQDQRDQEAARLAVVEEREAAAREELARDDDRTKWVSDGMTYMGRETIIFLPRALRIDGATVEKVHLRQGVNVDVVSELKSRPTFEEPVSVAEPEWTDAIGPTKQTHDDLFASLQIGELFRSELTLT